MNKTNKTNYARFYSLLKQMPGAGTMDTTSLKEDLVWQFTNLRTQSLKEMRESEYNNMCAHMQQVVDKHNAKIKKPLSEQERALKAARSAVLTRLQKMGIDTTDFGKVDQFCMINKIAGKLFRHLTLDELKDLIPKLEAMMAKGYGKNNNNFPICLN
jgi:hypothetical protein